MSLQEWQRNGWLIEHRTSAQEVADLLAVVRRDLHDAQAGGLSADWRLSIAYNAALQAATTALAAPDIERPGMRTIIGQSSLLRIPSASNLHLLRNWTHFERNEISAIMNGRE